MGYAAQPFAIDIKKLKSVFGSKDQNLLDWVKKSNMYEVYADQDDEGLYDRCLEDIIFNYIKPEDREEKKRLFGLLKSKPDTGLNEGGYAYGYALMAICDTMGIFLSEGQDIFYSGTIFKQANALLEQNGCKFTMQRFWETERIFDIPEIGDFPVISSFSKKEIRYLYDELGKINIIEPEDGLCGAYYDEPEELLKCFKIKLKVCIDNDVEWLSFLH